MTDLLHEGLICDPASNPVAAERIQARGHEPGKFKVELHQVQEKVSALRRKANLTHSARLQRVYAASEKSHVERLLDFNFRTLLREAPAGKDFYLAGNGRLVKRIPHGSRISGQAGMRRSYPVWKY